MNPNRILAIDVGAGTQDILLWEAGQPMENNVKLVLPSWTTVLARRVRQATQEGRPVFLTGNLMGGGPLVSAMKRHLRAGYPVYVTPRAALTIRDNLEQVRERGYTILLEGEEPPDLPNLLTLRTRDVDLDALAAALAPFGVTIPETVAVAVQDHGECLEGSNRKFRFQLWREFVEGGGEMIRLAYREPPPHYTRMRAVQQDAPGAVVMDTGPAALWGILEDERAAAHQGEGLIAVNVGNQHTLGVLLRGGHILGLFEHHTVLMTPEKLMRLIDRLRAGTLTNEEVYDDHGHGAFIGPDYSPDAGFDFVAVTGPQRYLAAALDYYFAAPHGDMMLTGCFGLVTATRRLMHDA
nr:pyruvate formate lyase-activating protein [Anaerolineae bacterium]